MPTESVSRIEELIRQAEALLDPAARRTAIELVQAVLQLHAEALDRILEVASSSGSRDVIETLAADDLVSSVLALHGLHPDSFDARIRRAMDKLRRHFDSRGSAIELLAAEPARVHVHFTGSRPGAGAAARRVIEDVLYEAAPEIESLVVDGADEPHEEGFVPLSALLERQTV